MLSLNSFSMADSNTHALIKEMLDETLNGKLKETTARILRAIGKQHVEENNGTSTQ